MLRVLGPRPSYRALLARLAPSEAVSGVYLGRLGDLLGCFSIILEVSWVALMPHWGRLGGLLGYLWGPPPPAVFVVVGGGARSEAPNVIGRARSEARSTTTQCAAN